MKLSVIIPVYNEENTIKEILERVKNVKVEKEIIVVDDGSIDQTKQILEEERKKGNIFLYDSPINFGKGAAVRIGFKYVTGDIIMIQDADLEYDPNDYQKLIEPIINGRASVVYGSRFLEKNKQGPFFNYIANRLLSTFTSILFRTKITDMETCYKAFKADILKQLYLKSLRFDIEPELTAKFIKKGYTIHEVPINYNPRGFLKGKKIRWRDGFIAFYALLKYRFKD